MPGAHKEAREASWKENLRVQNLVDEGARKTLLLALVPLMFSHYGGFMVELSVCGGGQGIRGQNWQMVGVYTC